MQNDVETLLKNLFLKYAKEIPKTKYDIYNLSEDKKEDMLEQIAYAYGLLEE